MDERLLSGGIGGWGFDSRIPLELPKGHSTWLEGERSCGTRI
jgi:hypothetical protein